MTQVSRRTGIGNQEAKNRFLQQTDAATSVNERKYKTRNRNTINMRATMGREKYVRYFNQT